MAFRAFTSDGLVVSKPAGVQDGDIVLVAFIGDAGGGTMTVNAPDASWTTQVDARDAGPGVRLKVFWKVAAGEPATWTFTIAGGAAYYFHACAAYSGRSGTPINAQSAASRIAQSGGVTTFAAPSITPSVDGCDVIGIFGSDDTADHRALTSADGSTTVRGTEFDAGTSVMIAIEDFNQSPKAAFAPSISYASAPAQGSWVYALALAPGAAAMHTGPFTAKTEMDVEILTEVAFFAPVGSRFPGRVFPELRPFSLR
jgi:hypothetical protein